MAWKGFNTVFGLVKAAVWGTPVAVVANDQVLINQDSLEPDARLIQPLSLTGTPFQAPGDKGNEFHSGDVPTEADYETMHRMIAFAFGTAGVPVQQGVDSAWKHTLRVAASLEGIFSTVIIASAGEFLREYITVKHNGLSMTIDMTGDGNRGQITYPMIPNGLNINTASGTNDLSTLANVSLPANADVNYVLSSQLEVLINDASGGALSSPTDEVFVSTVSMAVVGALPTDDVTTQFAPLIDEPIRDGFVEITGTLNFSKLTTSSRIAEVLSKARKKMKWTTTGPLANGSTNYLMEVWFSNVQFETGTFSPTGPERVPEVITFRASRATSTLTGFPNADAITMEIVNQDNADPLA